jgi:MYXO-CTERM domain-containing protein
MSKQVITRGSILLLGIVTLGSWAAPAWSQSCPSEYSACDNGGCCPSSGQCCPTLAEGCCTSYAPYCCGDGTCATSPGQCASPSAPACSGYSIPCGAGCAPAGSDCCDDQGYYCDPESRCDSLRTCIIGVDIVPASLVVPTATPSAPPERPRIISPLDDPEDAAERSCSITRVRGSGAPRPVAWGALFLLGLARLRRRWPPAAA